MSTCQQLLMLKSNIKYLVVFKIRHDFTEAEQAPLFCLAWYLSRTSVTRQKREHSKWWANLFSSQVFYLPACNYDGFSFGVTFTALQFYRSFKVLIAHKEKTVFGKARKKKLEENTGKDELKLITKLTQESWKLTTTFWKAWAIRCWKLARFNCSMMRKARRIVTQVIPAEPRIAISSILPPFDSYEAVEEGHKNLSSFSDYSEFSNTLAMCSWILLSCKLFKELRIHPFVFQKCQKHWMLWISDVWAPTYSIEFSQSRDEATFHDLMVLLYAGPLIFESLGPF